MATKTQNPGTADDTGQGNNGQWPEGIDPSSAPNEHDAMQHNMSGADPDYDPYAGTGLGHNQALGDPSDPRAAGGRPAPVHSPYDNAGNADSDPKSSLRNAEENPDGSRKGSSDEGDSTSDDKSGNKSDSNEADPGWLRDSESSPEEAGFANGFNEPSQGNNKKRGLLGSLVGGQIRKRNRRVFLMASAVSAIVSLIVAVFTFIPFKVNHIIDNIHDHFSAGPNAALDLAAKVIFNEYIKEFVIPAYASCGTTIDRNCRVNVALSSNPALALYHNMANDGIEKKMAGAPYYIEISKNEQSGHWHIKTPRTDADGVDIGSDGGKLLAVLDNPDFKELRGEILYALNIETGMRNAFMRYKIDAYLARKFGEKRCIFACSLRERVKAPVEDAKLAAKYLLAQRILRPISETKYLAIMCVLSDCNPTDVQSNGTDPPTSELENDQRHTLGDLAQQSGSGSGLDYDKAKAEYKDIATNGFSQHMIESTVKKIVGVTVAKAKGEAAGEAAAEASSKAAARAIPIIGWIHLAAQTTKTIDEAGAKLEKITYVFAAAAAYNYYQQYKTYADETKTGNVDSNEMGSMVNALGPGVEDPDNPLVGGTASAEESPLYQAIVSNKSALEGETQVSSKKYLCNDGAPLPAGKLICPEEELGASSSALDKMGEEIDKVCLSDPATNAANLLGAGLPCAVKLTTAASLWNNTIGAAINAGDDVLAFILGGVIEGLAAPYNLGCNAPSLGPVSLSPLPGNELYCDAKDAVPSVAEGVIGTMATLLLPNPWGLNMGGGRTAQLLFAGGAVEGKEACHKLGCKDVSPERSAQIIDEQKTFARQTFERQPFTARMFNIHDDMSLVSMVAMQTPLNYKVSAQNSVAGMLLNPFNSLSRGFGGIFSSGKAMAATNPSAADPYNIGGGEFPADQAPSLPSKYLAETDCKASIEAWQNKAAESEPNPNTGMPVYTEANTCQWLTNAIGSMGAGYDWNMLDPEDTAEMRGTPTATAEESSASEPAGDIDVAKLFEDSSEIGCAEGTKDLGTHTGYHDNKGVKIRLCAVEGMKSTSEDSTPGNEHYVDGANGNVMVNSRVSKNFVAMVNAAKDDGVPMSANSSFRSMKHQQQLCNGNGACSSGNYATVAKPGTSNHQMGIAIDFAMANQSKYSLSTGNCVTKNGVCTAPGDKVWEWLKKNAGKYGFKQYSREFWHWSPNGS